MRFFISQPMNGLSEEQILEERNKIAEYLKTQFSNVEILDSYFEDYPGANVRYDGVWYLGKSIELLSKADMAYFGRGWRYARGCMIEHKIAVEYGIPILLKEDEIKDEMW